MTLLKRIMIVSCLGLPLLATAQSKSVPYTSALANDADWTTINANNDDQTWQAVTSASDFTGSGFTSGIKYRYHSTNAADDWYISPAISLEAGKEYKVKYWYKTAGSYDEKWTLYCATGNTPEELSAGTVIDDKDGKFGTITKSTQIFTPETSGDYYFAFYAHSDKDKLNLFITGFQIAENVFGPGAPTDVTVTRGDDYALTATLAWTLPTVDNDGAPLPEGYTVNNVTIYRDDTLAATLDGAATTWTDTAETGLTPGKHLYEVQVTINDAPSARTGVTCGWVGPITAQNIPWDADIQTLSESDFNDFYTKLIGDVSTLTGSYGWKRSSSSYNGNEIILSCASNKRADNWLVLPKLVFPEAGVYKLSLNGKYSDYDVNEVVLDFYLGSEKTIENLSAGLKGTIERMPTAYVDRELYFRVSEAGEYYPALYASGKTGSSDLCIKSMKIEKSFETCSQPTDLTVTDADGTVTISWTNPATNNMGTALSGNLSKIEILRGEELIETITDEARLAAGAEVSTTDTPAGNGVFTYTVRPYFDGHEASGTPATVTSPWIGDPTQTLPYTTNFGTQTERSLFTAVGMSGNEGTWTLSNDGAELETPTGDGNTRTLNDLLMTPPFDLDEAYYKVTVSLKGGKEAFPIKFGLVADGDENHTLINPQTLPMTGYVMSSKYIYLKADAAGKYRLGILAEGEIANCANIFITHLDVREQPVTPAVATDLTVTVDPEDIYSATVTWKNPATCNIPDVVPAITKVEILRDDELLATVTEGLVAGEMSSYTDTGVGAEHPGKHNYEVKAYTGENTASYNHPKVLSPWIGDAVKAPYEPENFQDFETMAVTGTRTWSINSYGYAYFWGTSTPTNAWLFSPLMQVEKGAEYEISITPYLMSEYYDPVSFKAFIGNAATNDAMTTEVGTLTGSQILTEAEPFTFTVRGVDADEPAATAEGEGDTATAFSVPAGNICVGFYANELGECYVRNFKFIQTVFPVNPPSGITEIEAAADGDATYYNLQGIRVLNPQGGIYIRVKDGRSQKVIIRK